MAFVKIAAAILLVTSVPVLAVDLSAPIVGCSEVNCPTLTNTTSADCRVADRSFTIIGIANLNTSLDEDFTWTKGIETYDNVDPEVDYPRTYENNFYLGTPQGFDLAENATSSGYGACALFFTRVADEVRFEGDDPQLAVGTCSDAMNSDCVDALLKQATDVMRSNSSTSNSCQQLLTTFTDNLVSQCSQFATDGKWQGLKVQDLTGSGAPQPLTEVENATSNCHPTLPKSNSLTRIAALNTTGTADMDFLQENLFGITPILTVFYPRNGSASSVIREPEARLTCLKGTGMTDAEIATMGSTDPNKDSAATALAFPKLLTLGLGLMLSVLILT